MGIKELRETIRQLAERENVAVLVSSHLLAEMEMMCDRVGIINKGRMVSIRKLADGDVQNRWFEVDKADQAYTVIRTKYPHAVLAVTEKTLKVQADPQMTALINEALVQAGIAVYGITAESRSLEDLFMEDTENEISGQINLE